jgi:outer membrane biosynthesis protein TonB
MNPDNRRKEKTTAWAVSLGLHTALILLFIFLVAWKEPFPPHPEYGIELNFGIDPAGSGLEQPEQPPAEAVESVETPAPVQETAEPAPVEPVEEVVEQSDEPDQLPDFDDASSPVPVEKSEAKKVVKPEESKPKSVPKPATETTKPAEKPRVEEKKVDTKALYPSASSQGNQTNKAGDAGNPEGAVDQRALYGKPGGGQGGPQLELAGWAWDKIPRPNDTSSESGRIVFEIKVNDLGEIVGVRTLETTVSPAVEQIYRREVYTLTFTPTSSTSIPPVSVGKITFLIRSK